jgi:hypothetical protein
MAKPRPDTRPAIIGWPVERMGLYELYRSGTSFVLSRRRQSSGESRVQSDKARA